MRCDHVQCYNRTAAQVNQHTLNQMVVQNLVYHRIQDHEYRKPHLIIHCIKHLNLDSKGTLKFRQVQQSHKTSHRDHLPFADQPQVVHLHTLQALV